MQRFKSFLELKELRLNVSEMPGFLRFIVPFLTIDFNLSETGL